jgi:hypothetical protein
MSGLAFAEGTEGTDWNWDPMNSIPQAKHHHHYNEYETPVGIGLDLMVCEVGDIGVEFQSKYDFTNDVYSGFLVGKVNLWKIIER